ncbi:uncharacterized protein LOC127264351 [Andrographis paniculata]|uniref:uncharacterized protein LOC127264351 n=1 Tax=Andrographis paniculata TaxID=175694 RepID=UPI0021E83244|nr:uncharacterized protein LOC127264351 [Andrographis paniculata]
MGALVGALVHAALIATDYDEYLAYQALKQLSHSPVASVAHTGTFLGPWVLDSGASHHLSERGGRLTKDLSSMDCTTLTTLHHLHSQLHVSLPVLLNFYTNGWVIRVSLSCVGLFQVFLVYLYCPVSRVS